MFEKTEYKDFPLPRLVFGFSVSADSLITDVQLRSNGNGQIMTPKSKMFVYPFSNVRRISDFAREVTCCRQSNHCISLAGSLPYFIF